MRPQYGTVGINGLKWQKTKTKTATTENKIHIVSPCGSMSGCDGTHLIAAARIGIKDGKFVKRSFSVFGPTTWNSLPVHARQSQCLVTLKNPTKDVSVHETPVAEWGRGGRERDWEREGGQRERGGRERERCGERETERRKGTQQMNYV